MKKIVIGIDVGISTTKIVGIDESGVVVSPIRIKATDPITSLYGAFGKYLHDNKIALSDVEQVMLTGVGSAYIDEPIYGLPTSKSEEFVADGLGARYESKLDRMIVVASGMPCTSIGGVPMTSLFMIRGSTFIRLSCWLISLWILSATSRPCFLPHSRRNIGLR